jgi:hypothetical protein
MILLVLGLTANVICKNQNGDGKLVRIAFWFADSFLVIVGLTNCQTDGQSGSLCAKMVNLTQTRNRTKYKTE